MGDWGRDFSQFYKGFQLVFTVGKAHYSKECRQIHHAWLKLQELESATSKVSYFTGLQVSKKPRVIIVNNVMSGIEYHRRVWCLLLSKQKSR